jgi:hypothetical protein
LILEPIKRKTIEIINQVDCFFRKKNLSPVTTASEREEMAMKKNPIIVRLKT